VSGQPIESDHPDPFIDRVELRRCLTPQEVFLQSANFPQCFGMIEHQQFFRQLIGVGEINLRQSARHLVQGGRVETRAAQKNA
jgi:hypothetical protein